MRTVRISLKGTVPNRALAADMLREPGDAVIVERGTPRLFVLKCPCGCGEDLLINLDARAGKAWRLYVRSHKGVDKVTLYPSVWRDTKCESHFIVWADRILLFGARSDDEIDIDYGFLPIADDDILALLTDQPTHFTEIADNLDIIPWDAQRACQRLVRSGKAFELKGKSKGSFIRSKKTESDELRVPPKPSRNR
jgi:Family of unknown function (DUF6527)